MPIPYTKQWNSLSDQVSQLQSYGLTIPDRQTAEQFLQHINYYRFCGYGLAFEQSRHNYIPETTFDKIRQSYEFDRSFRDLITESLEIIELDVRATIAYTFARTYGPFGHTDSVNFTSRFGNSRRNITHHSWTQKLQSEAKRSSELFIQHFKRTYAEFPNLPVWTAAEIMSFGALSTMYNAMHSQDQKNISSRYNLQPKLLASILHHLVYLRNLCAHHARIWDKTWKISPLLPAGKVWKPPLLPDNGHIFATLLLQSVILNKCHAEIQFYADWKKRVEELIENQFPATPNALNRMGLTINWQNHPKWENN